MRVKSFLSYSLFAVLIVCSFVLTSKAQTVTNTNSGLLPRANVYVCLGGEANSDSIQITLFNFGLDTLTTVNLAWFQDSTLVGYKQWVGSLLTGESEGLTLGSFNFTHLGTTSLMFTSSSPNNKIDSDKSNDTLLVDVHIGAGFTLPPLQDQSFCAGSSVSLNTQQGYKEYQWNTGDTTSGVTVFSPGLYTVLVEDSFGCTFKDTVSLSNYPSPGFIVDTAYSYCANENPELTIDSTFFNIRWSSGDTGNVFSPSLDGYYEVSVTDGYGCNHKSLVFVESLESPNSGLPDSLSYCANEGVTLNAQGTQINSYLWSTGDFSPTTQVFSPGVYAVQLTHLNGCIAVDSVVVSENALPLVEIVGDTVLCKNDTVAITAITSESLTWNTGSSTMQLRVFQPGVYEVFVEDDKGCTNSSQVEVISELLSIDLGKDTIICDGDAILLDMGGAYTSAINWSDGSTQRDLQVIKGGEYWVEATGQHCTEADTINVKQRYAPLTGFNFVVSNNTVEFFNTTTDANSYLWTFGDGNNSQNIDPIHFYTNAGFYPVTLTAYNVCGLSKQTDTISVNSLGIGELGHSGKVQVYPNPATEFINISFEDYAGNVELALIDALGRTLQKKQVVVFEKQQTSFMVNHLAKGVYFVSIVSAEKEVLTVPIVIN